MSRGRNHKRIEQHRRNRRRLEHQLNKETHKLHARLLTGKLDELPSLATELSRLGFKTHPRSHPNKLREILLAAQRILDREEQRSEYIKEQLHNLSEDPNVTSNELSHFNYELRAENARTRYRKSQPELKTLFSNKEKPW